MARDTYNGYPLVSDQVNAAQVAVVCRELKAVLEAGIMGDVVEFGCYVGTTSLFIQRLLQPYPDATFHVYDSFAGLPPKQPQDASPAGTEFQAGELTASRQELVRNFKQAGLPLPVVHKAWFNELTNADVPEHISFAFLDGDFYRSIMDSLKLVWPRLQPGGRIIFDDYNREALPGVQRAGHDYFAGSGLPMPQVRIEQNLGIIRI